MRVDHHRPREHDGRLLGLPRALYTHIPDSGAIAPAAIPVANVLKNLHDLAD